MRKNYNKLKLLSLSALMLSMPALANIDLLNTPSTPSSLATKSVVTAITASNNNITAVGERGHIIQWQSNEKWQQHQSPVSVLLTSIITLSDGTSVAVGHDAAILRSTKKNQWQKVFDGFELTTLKIALLEQQQAQLEQQMTASEDEDELEELEYQLDEVVFSLEDAQAEQEAGPNKPLLSLVTAKNDVLFAAGAYGTLLQSKDKGVTWQLIEDRLENPDKFHLNAITYNNNVLTIVGENGISFSSLDEGESWEFNELPYPGSIFGVVGNQQSNHLVAFGLQGNVLLSNDLGQSWQHVDMGNSISVLGGTMTEKGDVYLVGHGGTVSHFNINTPTQVTVRKHPSGSAFSAVHVQNEQLVLAGQFGLTAWQFK